MYNISYFTTGPISSLVPVSPSSSINGFGAIALSEDYTKLYVNNVDTTTTNQLVIISYIPCFTGDCEILTPNGYIRVDKLEKGQLVRTPDYRDVPIVEIFSSEIIVNKDNAPYVIPANFFGDFPSMDIMLSPHHAYMNNGEWKLPVWTEGLHQTIDMIGKPLTYYHIKLANYTLDKLVCSGIIVDSWNGNEEDNIY